MCLFVSESDEVFGTLRMYGAAACCNSRVHGRNVVLWPPLPNTRLVTLTGALRAQPAIAPCGPAAPQVTASCSVRLCPVVCTISKPRAVRRRRRVRGYGVHNYRETASELCAYLWFYTRVQDPWIFVINCKQFSEVRAIRSTEQYYSTVVSPLLLACYISVYPYFGQFSSKKYRVQKFSYSGKAGLGGSGGVYTRYSRELGIVVPSWYSRTVCN